MGPKAIPRARAILQQLLQDDTLTQDQRDAISAALALMYRRPYAKPVARAKARRVTPEIVAAVQAAVARNPTALNREIGRSLGIDGGRVSEVIHGDRK
jgi:hypothetical protein